MFRQQDSDIHQLDNQACWDANASLAKYAAHTLSRHPVLYSLSPPHYITVHHSVIWLPLWPSIQYLSTGTMNSKAPLCNITSLSKFILPTWGSYNFGLRSPFQYPQAWLPVLKTLSRLLHHPLFWPEIKGETEHVGTLPLVFLEAGKLCSGLSLTSG